MNYEKQIGKHYKPPREDGSDRVITACCADHPEVRYSALSDAVMNNIAACIIEYGDEEIFNKLWTSSMFPERLTKCVEQVVEDLGYKR